MQNIKKPTLLIDKSIALDNISTMKRKADNSGVILRPHFKTHQSSEIGEWFRSRGIEQITVSSVEMAYYFADYGWKDITIAFPLNVRELEEIVQLSEIVRLNVLISSIEQLKALNRFAKNQINYFIKIDVGYHRSGLETDQLKEIKEIINLESNFLNFSGLLSHFGNTYQAKNQNEIRKIYNTGVEDLVMLKKQLKLETEVIISVGDTPSCSLLDEFKDVDEIRPGNFVYYDLMQKQLEVCTEKQISVVVACPVIDIYPQRNEILIYGGAVHLSKEYIVDNQGNKNYGGIVLLKTDGWSQSLSSTYIKSISQEHGIISCDFELISQLKIGDLIGVIPVHSCLAADLLNNISILNID